ncbi:hypothetical protein [Terrarubrum flagellatum]|uniref:hypothetical protein n=1 Tax=Terrirubrum flagellatum TaxID=2895980 RepID=UPI003144DC7E
MVGIYDVSGSDMSIKIMLRRLISLSPAAAVASCASLAGDTVQSITIAVSPETAICRLTRSTIDAERPVEILGDVRGTTNLIVARNSRDILVVCTAPGFVRHQRVLKAEAARGGKGVLASMEQFLDETTGAAYSYPPSLDIKLDPA